MKEPNAFIDRLLLVLAMVCLVMDPKACWAQDQAATGKGPILLTDVTAQSGITFVHNTGSAGLGYLVEGVVGGICLFDYDEDGWIDIYLTNGAPLMGSKLPPDSLRPALYRNLGEMKFVDVTSEAGIDFSGYGLGAIAADYDDDGDKDLVLTNFGPNELYRNNGDKTFTRVTDSAGVGGRNEVASGACFLDADRDGHLDLFVASYVDFTFAKHVPIKAKGQYLMAGPQYYPSLPDSLFRNRGDGTFEDWSSRSDIGRVKGPGMGVVAADLDDDGDVDIFVAQDGAPNLLYVNDGTGNFEESALLSGVASTYEGKINGSMGVDCGDYDGDGRLDLIVTSYQSEMPVLYRNLGGGLFEDATRKAQLPTSLFPHVNWGTSFVDFDNDGLRDLFIANGHFDRVELMDDRTSLKLPNTLLRNVGNGKFVDVTSEAGSGLAVVESSRGVGFDDLDNDGDIDAVVLNSNALPTVLRNDSPGKNAWIQFQLKGEGRNRDAIGARVTVSAGGKTQVCEVHAGRGYQSHYGSTVHFGLGKAETVDQVTVRWPNGLSIDYGAMSARKINAIRPKQQPE
jgi:enediyne biosynthesis protein E4